MNTRQKLLAYPLIGGGLSVLCCIGAVPFVWSNPRMAPWAAIPMGVLPLAMSIGLLISVIRMGMRQKAARAKGLTLCSYCEYPLDFGEGPVVCPECGCKRTPQEHQAAWGDWRLWKR